MLNTFARTKSCCQVTNSERKCTNAFCLFQTHKKFGRSSLKRMLSSQNTNQQSITLLTINRVTLRRIEKAQLTLDSALLKPKVVKTYQGQLLTCVSKIWANKSFKKKKFKKVYKKAHKTLTDNCIEFQTSRFISHQNLYKNWPKTKGRSSYVQFSRTQ